MRLCNTNQNGWLRVPISGAYVVKVYRSSRSFNSSLVSYLKDSKFRILGQTAIKLVKKLCEVVACFVGLGRFLVFILFKYPKYITIDNIDGDPILDDPWFLTGTFGQLFE